MTTEDLYRCAEAFSQFGVSAEEADAALRRLSQLLMNMNDYDSQIVHLNTDVGELQSRLNHLESVAYPAADQVAYAMSEITAIKDSLHDTRHEFDEQITNIQCELCNLRSTLDAFTEKSNRKSDLEKIDSIMQINDWYENFIKEFKLIMTDKAKEIADKLNKVIIDKNELHKLYLDKQGYAFDSLVYRFKDYQARAFRAEVLQMKHDKNMTELEASQKVKDRHDRDLMRFIQILDEAIGEHN